MSADPLLLPERVPLMKRLAEKQQSKTAKTAAVDQERFNRFSPEPPLQWLQKSGFHVLGKESRGGVFVNVSQRFIGFSGALLALIGQPSRVHLLIRPDDGVLAVIAADANDTTAYSLSGRKDRISSGPLMTKLRAAGWVTGRHSARMENGAVIVERTP